MSQNKITAFIHNNLIATIITALIVGGGLSGLAFSTYNSGAKSVQNKVSSSSISLSSSSQIKSSLVTSSILSSSLTSSSSSEEVKKEVIKEPVKEAPKTVEVEKPRVIEEIKPIKITTPVLNQDKYVKDLVLNFSRFDNTMASCENSKVIRDGRLPTNYDNTQYDCDEYYFYNEPQNLGTILNKTFQDKLKISGKAKFQKEIGNFRQYSFDSDVKLDTVSAETKYFVGTILTFVSSTGVDINGFSNTFATDAGEFIRVDNKYFDISKLSSRKLKFIGTAKLLHGVTYELDSSLNYSLELIS
jgi:hypothetical protein